MKLVIHRYLVEMPFSLGELVELTRESESDIKAALFELRSEGLIEIQGGRYTVARPFNKLLQKHEARWSA